MKKLVIITGLTCSGKSSLALEIANKYNGEIISADSVQVYRGLDIGSAKVSKTEQNKVKHHLIDIKNFSENYNVAEFVKDCELAVNNIIAKNKLPIIVGGTGLYIQALLKGYSLGNTSNCEFRNKLEKQFEQFGKQFLWDKLYKINPDKANAVHPNNVRRVIRYLELENDPTYQITKSFIEDYEICSVGIIDDRQTIYNKINLRVDDMLKSGLENEVRTLINLGAKKNMQSMSAIGYKEWFEYFEGLISYENVVDLIKQHSRNYCKRQLTFLKTISNLQLCSIEEASLKITNFLK